MVTLSLQSAIEAMSLDERLELVEDIENTVDQSQIEVTEEQKALILSRAAELETDPSLGLTPDELSAGCCATGVTRRRLVFHPGIADDLGAILDEHRALDPVLPDRFEADSMSRLRGSNSTPNPGQFSSSPFGACRSSASPIWPSIWWATIASTYSL
jgi:putative addiction module component (TIGR02574 family)